VKGSRSALLAAIALYAVVLAAVLAVSLSLTGGHLSYALDDAYIHMAIARTFSQHGVWGVSPYGFTSATSSPLWTFVLALLYKLIGPVEVLPFLINLLAAVGVLWMARRVLRRLAPGMRGRTVFFTLAAVVLFTPLVPLVFVGQEHTLHLLLTLLFAQLAVQRLSARQAPPGRPIGFLLLAAILPMVRYESLFLVLATAMLLALQRRGRQALLLGVVGFLPPIAYGLFAVSKGAYFLPNPILIKANLPGHDLGAILQTALGYTALRRLLINAHLLLLVLAALLLLVRRAGEATASARAAAARADGPRTLLVLFLIVTALHLTTADVGWFYRYEAYLVGLGLVALAATWSTTPDLWAEWTRGGVRRSMRVLAAIALAIVSLGALGDRGVRAVIGTPRATANIYEQQYQTGRFLREAYPGGSVALNDIGAANFLADIHGLDLMGLASDDVTAFIRAGTYNPRALEQLLRAHAVRIAIVYESWFRIPSSWRWVGSWSIRHRVVTGGETVSFYAVDPAEEGPLTQKLRQFAPRLPATVKQSGPYTGVR
jgi:hypothetical protein